jgi:hypothetical protein
MADIYEQHEKAFAKVSAWVILDQAGEKVATVAIKFPQDGAGRLWAYTHFLGVPMTRHHADGYGYDKRSPAVAGGFEKAKVPSVPKDDPFRCLYEAKRERLEAFQSAFHGMGGEDWTRMLEKAGFRVIQAV